MIEDTPEIAEEMPGMSFISPAADGED